MFDFCCFSQNFEVKDAPKEPYNAYPMVCLPPGAQLGAPGLHVCHGRKRVWSEKNVHLELHSWELRPWLHYATKCYDLGKPLHCSEQILFICKSEIIMYVCLPEWCYGEWGEELTLSRGLLSGAIPVGYGWLACLYQPLSTKRTTVLSESPLCHSTACFCLWWW